MKILKSVLCVQNHSIDSRHHQRYILWFYVLGPRETSDLSRISLIRSSKCVDGRREEHQPHKEFLEARHGELRQGGRED